MPIASTIALQARIDQTMTDMGGAYFPVNLRSYTVTQAADPDLGAPTSTTADTLLSPPPLIEDVNVREIMSAGGLYQSGDRRFTVSSTAASWSQAQAATDLVITSTPPEVLRIVERRPEMVVGGQILTWQLVAGVRRSSQ